MSNLFRFFCCISSLQVTAEADVNGCVFIYRSYHLSSHGGLQFLFCCWVRSFLLCKVLVVSLIVDNLCKSLQEEIFWAFFWSFYNQFFAHVSAESNISGSFRALCFWSCAQVTAGSNVLGSFSAFSYQFCEQVTTGASVWRFLSFILCKSYCGSNCYISFSVF